LLSSASIMVAEVCATHYISVSFICTWDAGAGEHVTLALILGWLWTGTGRIPEEPIRDVGMGLSLPTYLSGPASIGWWAMLITMLADQAAFVTLVFSEFYFWTVSIPYPEAGTPAPSTVLLITVLLLGAAAWSLVATARRLVGRERPGRARLALLT